MTAHGQSGLKVSAPRTSTIEANSPSTRRWDHQQVRLDLVAVADGSVITHANGATSTVKAGGQLARSRNTSSTTAR